MRLGETVTFGGGGLDRDATARVDDAGLRALACDPTSRHLPLWRGKVQFTHAPDGAPHRLGWVASGSPVLHGVRTSIYLGRHHTANGVAVACFAHDVSDWAPAEMAGTLGAFDDPSQQHHPAAPASLRFGDLRRAMTRLAAPEAELAATARAVSEWHRTHGFCARCGAASVPAQGGWRRDCPACGGHHFPRTDPVVIMLVTRGNSVLLGRAPGWPPRMYSLLAGFVEPGETIEGAVRRETFEETAVRVGAVTYLASQPWPFPASLMLGCHGVALGDAITADPAEIEDARWLTREEMAQVAAGRHPTIEGARPGAIAHFLLSHWLSDTLG